ncbi:MULTISPECIES: ATP-dependent helicase [unclassified Clostridioides]|uniref:ATP-dependent helicase n=1 Tax=unclassified Clostridioides TaxID=2635829 RepID=UPI001D117AD3|nr:ATP-dependent helicase [Clostridioides sp. ES-S-0001-02]MCC0640655.1 ATP-dependent helicase [Clostridioides sp. ES-S-0049-03]MCC0657365.1 ATP-dependent helicase [Clostridioides sp. ES-S-0123-01]MCC0676676.1 ATP-dependent helicase [Clostridioides sp. ES-W-0018-02]MCC0693949.1 ATP-dependent helicase [Clostridioides sp. ES-S-0048-02]MCC0704973.1 ATP-dependent helicase [Clostridioides sp. ES-S-0049-02]MCC0708476.1 ATP-dependent helicase [Clostridioides sp. ES-S-0190-01]MCC0711941.1 ATP-depend
MININYREDQIPIINYEDGTMAVPAVPGAGKTFIITNLVAKLLLEQKHKGGKILVLTYMNSAVNNFKGRIKKILEENKIDDINSYEVMTIHSLAVKIIKEKPEIVMLSEDFNIADDLQKSIILNECINKFRFDGGERAFRWFLKEQKDERWKEITLEAWERGFFEFVGNAISELKYKGISPDKLEEILSRGHKGMLKVILPIYKLYDRKLKQNGLLDYDDILILAEKTLCLDEGLRKKFQTRYKYIFEDECQDSNEIQGNIIKIISSENNNLVRVGDINQSITGTFSSSDPRFFKEFIKNAKCCYRMDMSNRSSKDILDLANSLVEYVTKEFKQEECRYALEDMQIKTVPTGVGYKENPKPEHYNINVKWYNSWKNEIEQTAKYVKGIKKKYPDKSIGILVPFNEQVTQVAKELREYSLTFEELGPNSLSKRKVINSIASIIDFMLNCDDIEKLIIVLDKVFINTDNEIEEKNFLDRLKKYTTEEIIYDLKFNKDKFESLEINEESDIYTSFKYGIDIIKQILEYPIIRLDLLILFIGKKLNLEKEDKAVLDYISFYIKYLVSENIYMDLEDVYNVLFDVKNKVFNHIIDVVYEINGYEPEPGSITLCNYHKSKGMEWDCVFLLGLVEYNFPDNITQKFQSDKWYLKEKYKNPMAIIKSEIEAILKGSISTDYAYQTKIDSINEKIRLLYVGITRAKEMLVLSGSAYRDENDIGNKRKEQNPCVYLRRLNQYIIEKRSN